MDVYIPMLERMYHKRLKGYAELGYQVKFGSAAESVSAIYDGHSALTAFERDISDAAKSIAIVSPYLQVGRVNALLPALQSAISRGVEVTLCTREVSNYDREQQSAVMDSIRRLKETGVVVRTYEKLQQRYTIIDKSIVCYGNVDFLAFGRKDSDVLRFENADIAGELSAVFDDTDCEQLFISDVDM